MIWLTQPLRSERSCVTLWKNTTNACRVTRVCFLIIEHRENLRGIKAPCENQASSRIRDRFFDLSHKSAFYIDLSGHRKLCISIWIIFSIQRCFFCLNCVFYFFFEMEHCIFCSDAKIFTLVLSRPIASMRQFCEWFPLPSKDGRSRTSRRRRDQYSVRSCTVWGQVSTFSASNSPSFGGGKEGLCNVAANPPCDIEKHGNDFITSTSIAQVSSSSVICIRDRNHHFCIAQCCFIWYS